MNANDAFFLPDVQSSADTRRLAIQRVGVRGLRYPLALKNSDGSVAHSVATVSMSVGLQPEVKGTHMSRFVELLEARAEPLTQTELMRMLDEMLARLDAGSGRIELAFPFFIRKTAPVSGVESLLDYDVTLIAEQREKENSRLTMRVSVPVTSLCPCSKEISAYGAHNQRSLITLEARLKVPMPPEDLVRIAEEQASCQLFGLLKRPDEKWVTERAYENPKFVEDLVRDVALRLMRDARILDWRVASENFESIHNHSAYAELWGSNEQTGGVAQ
jgi:GTP cyclohydrolase IB